MIKRPGVRGIADPPPPPLLRRALLSRRRRRILVERVPPRPLQHQPSAAPRGYWAKLGPIALEPLPDRPRQQFLPFWLSLKLLIISMKVTRPGSGSHPRATVPCPTGKRGRVAWEQGRRNGPAPAVRVRGAEQRRHRVRLGATGRRRPLRRFLERPPIRPIANRAASASARNAVKLAEPNEPAATQPTYGRPTHAALRVKIIGRRQRFDEGNAAMDRSRVAARRHVTAVQFLAWSPTSARMACVTKKVLGRSIRKNSMAHGLGQLLENVPTPDHA